jgi:hypothetical protein
MYSINILERIKLLLIQLNTNRYLKNEDFSIQILNSLTARQLSSVMEINNSIKEKCQYLLYERKVSEKIEDQLDELDKRGDLKDKIESEDEHEHELNELDKRGNLKDKIESEDELNDQQIEEIFADIKDKSECEDEHELDEFDISVRTEIDQGELEELNNC